MIPKVIHYCWFGRGKLPYLARKCIRSWHKFLPGYEIREWNEDNFDVRQIPYTSEAYDAGKYAFVSDYARFKILFNNGGVYFDTDVEIIRSLDDILEAGPFMGLEKDFVSSGSKANGSFAVAPGLGLAANPGLGLYNKILQAYSNRHFIKENGALDLTTIVQITTGVLLDNGLKARPGVMEIDGIRIYPKEYFCPIAYETGVSVVTSNTRTIHHFTASWWTPRQRAIRWTNNHLGKKCGYYVAFFWQPLPVVLMRLYKALIRRLKRVAGR